MQVEETKVVLLGDTGVGKSSILRQFVNGQYQSDIKSTLGTAFLSKTITTQAGTFKFQIWDTAGQEQYKSLAPLYYRDARVGVIVYDITSANSFKVLKSWIEELNLKGPEDIRLVILGNKSDLSDHMEVPYEDACKFAKSVGAMFGMTSAKQNRGITDIFNELTLKLEEDSHKVPPKPRSEVKRISTETVPSNSNNACAC